MNCRMRRKRFPKPNRCALRFLVSGDTRIRPALKVLCAVKRKGRPTQFASGPYYMLCGLPSLFNSNKSPGEFCLNLTANTPTVPCPVLLQSRRTTLLSRISGVFVNEVFTFIDRSAAGGGMNADQRNAPMGDTSLMNA